jgi:hypothetical protein
MVGRGYGLLMGPGTIPLSLIHPVRRRRHHVFSRRPRSKLRPASSEVKHGAPGIGSRPAGIDRLWGRDFGRSPRSRNPHDPRCRIRDSCRAWIVPIQNNRKAALRRFLAAGIAGTQLNAAQSFSFYLSGPAGAARMLLNKGDVGSILQPTHRGDGDDA